MQYICDKKNTLKSLNVSLMFRFSFCILSESQKTKAASSSQKKFDIISSAVRSALGRHDKESVTVEVNIHTHVLSVFVYFAQDRTRDVSACDCRVRGCYLFPGSPASQSFAPKHPSQSHCCVCAVGRPALWGCLIISLNGFGLSQLIAPEWA